MAVYSLATYTVHPDQRTAAEEAMHAYASYVRKDLEHSTWTVYRDGDAGDRYVAMIRDETPAAVERRKKAEGTKTFEAAIASLAVGKVDVMRCDLVTSSDLGRRHRAR